MATQQRDHDDADRSSASQAEAPAGVKEAIGEVLREERQDQDRTLADVAEAAWVSLQYLSEVERGRKDISSELLASVCRGLEVPVPDVLERAADKLRATGSTLDAQMLAGGLASGVWAQRRLQVRLLAA